MFSRGSLCFFCFSVFYVNIRLFKRFRINDEFTGCYFYYNPNGFQKMHLGTNNK